MSYRYNPLSGRLDFDTKAGGGASIWSRVSNSVTASSTGVVDSVANASFQALKYIVTVFNQANTSYRSFEFNILNENGSYKDSLSHNLKSAGFNIDVDTVNNAGTMELQITNNESYDVNVELAKLVLV